MRVTASLIVVATSAMGCGGREGDEPMDVAAIDSSAIEAGADAETETEAEAEADTEADAPTADGPRPCTATGHECGEAEYCDAPKCTSGTCRRRPTTPSLELAEVCGCDGITYWNADQAAARGVSIEYAGQCGPAPPPSFEGSCGPFFGDAPCPVGTRCVLVVPGCTYGDSGGQCWFVPPDATCPPSDADAGSYRDCDASTCIDYCHAVMSGTLVHGC